jgi:hypothetical protein
MVFSFCGYNDIRTMKTLFVGAGGGLKQLLAVSLLLISIVSNTGCGRPEPTTSAPPTAQQPESPLKGVSLSPRSFQPADFNDFFVKAKQAGDIVSWAGDWQELGRAGSGANVVAELAATHGYIPLLEPQFFTQATGQLLRPLDEANRQAYIAAAVATVDKYKLKYLGIGIEVNILASKSPVDFDSFVRLYADVYDVVKAKSPTTKVFTIFQLELMKGLGGGLFGGTNDPSRAQWALLDRFPKSDLVAFTTYPGLIYKSPSEIPLDYYDDIRAHTAKPVAFTEIGWHSSAFPAGWESSEAEQADFVKAFFERTKVLKQEFSIWSFLYDQGIQPPFDSMGLYRADGNPKPAWDAWISRVG